VGIIVLWVVRFFKYFLSFSFFVYYPTRWFVFVLFVVSPTKVRLPHNPLASVLQCISHPLAFPADYHTHTREL